MADSLTYISTDFSDGVGKLIAANGINVIRVEAHLDTTDTDAYCIVDFGGYTFRLVNKSFDGDDGEFYIDLTDIIPAMFTDVTDNEIETGQQSVIDTFLEALGWEITLYDSTDTAKASLLNQDVNLLFSAPYFDAETGTYLESIYNGYMPDQIAQKNKISYFYYFNSDATTAREFKFTKIDKYPTVVNLTDNYDVGLTDNEGNQLIILT